jgi:ArsR family transcriptional regulator, arsenate/arsenite/antimonite-responsive transcriptional repressor
MASISILVNIEIHRYHAGTMAKRSTDPDIQLLAALADPARMEILRELAGSSEVCACDLTTCCDVRQPTVSHHLKVLRDAGAVRSERRGNRVYYWISPDLNDRLARIAQTIMPGGLIPVGALTKRSSALATATATELPA